MARLAVIVRGERVSLVAPAREPFVDRWVEMNDPELGMALGAATSTLSPTARVMPPISREQREALYEAHVARELLVFELWLACSESPETVAEMEVNRNYVIVRRGQAALKTGEFALANCYRPREGLC